MVTLHFIPVLFELFPGFTCWIVCSVFLFNLLWSPYLCFISLLYLDLYVLEDDAVGVFHANQISMCLDPHLS